MATARQIEANRRNAARSTGPRTEEGKAVSRGNAFKHGFAGGGVVVGQTEADEVARRAGEWGEAVRPAGPVEAFLVAQLATESVRVERCQREERALLERRSARAEAGWDEARRLEAEEIGARLAKDPERTVARLRQTLQGCDWLIGRWEKLAEAAESGRPWDVPQRFLALDLLGVPPEMRGDPLPQDPAHAPELTAAQRALASGQITALRRLKTDVLAPRDRDERTAAEAGVGPGDAATEKALALVRRYESACQRRLHRALSLLLSGRLAARPTAAGAEPAAPASDPPPPHPPAPANHAPPAPPAPGEPEPPVLPVDAGSAYFVPPGRAADLQPKGNRRWRKEQLRRDRERAARELASA